MKIEKAAPGTLCEVCDEQGKGRVPAVSVIDGTWMCKDCEKGEDAPVVARKSTPVTEVIINSPIADEWRELFDRVDSLPPAHVLPVYVR